jgi:phosphohistidine phosphatase
VYLIRHAHAEDGVHDDARPLSAKGRRQIREVARWLRHAKAFEAEEIWSSPLVRAQDTAARLVEQLKLTVPVQEVSGLRPEDDPALTARRLRETRRTVAIVGHDPHLSALASLLVAGKEEPARFRLKKCAVLRLDRGSVWTVRWQISPELL